MTRRDGSTLTFALTIDDEPRVQPLLADYAALTGVSVQTVAVADLYRRLNIELMGGTCELDVVSLDDPWLPIFAGGGFLADLDELAARQGTPLDADDFVPGFLALCRISPETGLQAVPWIGNVQFFAWRSDLLAEFGLDRPATWDDVLANARAITAAGRPGLFGVGLRGEPGNAAATTFLPILRGYGADIVGADWEPRLLSNPAIAAMSALLELVRLAPPGVETVGHEQLGAQLASGAIAQAADIWPNQLLEVFDSERSVVAGKVEIGPEPAQPGASPACLTGNWLLGVPAACETNAGAALDFIRWLTAPEQQRRLLLERGLPATRLSVLQDPAVVASLPFLPAFVEAARVATPRPRTALYPAIEEVLGRWVAEAIAGTVGGDAALAGAQREIREMLVREGLVPPLRQTVSGW